MSTNKIDFPKKIVIFVSIIVVVLFGIAYISNKGVYFWNVKDIFENVRLEKWLAGTDEIKEMWVLGDDFNTHISNVNKWESTLSDNSFLLAIAHFGIVFWSGIFIYEFIRIVNKPKAEIKNAMPAVIVAVIMMFLYDFIQVYPANYIMIYIYIMLNNKYHEGKNQV